jgi:hypothetical protein
MDIEQAKKLVGKELRGDGVSEKVNRYIGKFCECRVKNERILAKVKGNYGEYTVSLKLDARRVDFNCSCYVGKHGCHHCLALAHTFLKDSESFEIITETKRSDVKNLEQLGSYLDYVTLGELMDELKSVGISQKEFAKATGTTSQHLSSVKTSETRNRFYKGLGATKLACLWMIENAKKIEKNDGKSKKAK